jgi:hypothetical protein
MVITGASNLLMLTQAHNHQCDDSQNDTMQHCIGSKEHDEHEGVEKAETFRAITVTSSCAVTSCQLHVSCSQESQCQ